MKKILFLMICSSLFVSTLSAQKIKGSDTVLPLTQKEAEEYAKVNSSSDVIVTGGGSGVGLSSLVEGTCDIAMASRKIKVTEKLKLQNDGKKVVEEVIAYDAIAVVINPANKVTNLTREQLESIFTGKITNWKEVGGDDLKIVVYSRETSSGTYEFFKESVLAKKNYMSSVLSMPATGAIMQSVTQTKGAIGYVGLAYLNDDVKAVHVSYDQGKTFVAPSVANAKNKTYPIVRPLLYYYVESNAAKAKPFIDFVLSDKGQTIVSAKGYVPVK
ncbi:MAG: PstS family phosphate ABC transporter substrate-binding protein [Rikenellaceae bacterium]